MSNKPLINSCEPYGRCRPYVRQRMGLAWKMHTVIECLACEIERANEEVLTEVYGDPVPESALSLPRNKARIDHLTGAIASLVPVTPNDARIQLRLLSERLPWSALREAWPDADMLFDNLERGLSNMAEAGGG